MQLSRWQRQWHRFATALVQTLLIARATKMRLFSCQSCSQILYFENVKCERCQHPLGYAPDADVLSALEPAGQADIPPAIPPTWRALGIPDRTFRYCSNAQYNVCNWLVDANSTDVMCTACRHNSVIPELSSEENRLAWHKIEMAKHRLFYTLNRLGLLRTVDIDGGSEPLVFKFMADSPTNPTEKVMTGHEDGLITISLAEADDAEREQRRKLMGEPYRTLLGHFRHEVGHFYWDKLVRDGGKLAECRAVFGDDELNYEEALKLHYQNGAPLNWQQNFVSTYATSHAWEDFAETWAHYLHIVDTLEMAQAYNLQLSPSVDKDGEFKVNYGTALYDAASIKPIIDVWLPVSTALNSLSRSMGKEELYPFILSEHVIRKLDFMHGLVRGVVAQQQQAQPKTAQVVPPVNEVQEPQLLAS